MKSRVSSSGLKTKQLKTFTYFIPAPPARKNGYREKDFDKIMEGILQSGFELVDLQTQSMENGMFVLAILRVMNKKAAALDALLDMQDQFKLRTSHPSNDIILDDEDA